MPYSYPTLSIPAVDYSKIALLGALFFGLFPWVFSLSLQYTPAARGAIGLATIPIQTLIVAALFGREALTRYKILGVGLAFTGILVVFGPEVMNDLNSEHLFGDGLMLFGAFNAAIYSVFSRPLLERYGSSFVTTVAVLFGVLALFPATLVSGSIEAWPSFTAKGWVAVIFLGTIGGSIQFLLFSWALRWLAPTRTVIYLALNPLTAVLLAFVLLGEAIPPSLIVGLLLVLSGIFTANWTRRENEPLLDKNTTRYEGG